MKKYLALLLMVLCLSDVRAYAEEHSHKICGESDACDTNHQNHAAMVWAAWENDSMQAVDLDGGYSYLVPQKNACSLYLIEDIGISRTIQIQEDQTLNLCLNGYAIIMEKEGPVIEIQNGGTLNLCDCSTDEDGKITHLAGQKGSGIENEGLLNIFSGNISGNIVGNPNESWLAGVDGAGINNYGILNMYGGCIKENKTQGHGGGVHNTSIFNLYNGTITGNSANSTGDGGGVNNRDKFIMYGGMIANNAAFCGGGVSNSGTFTMNGGLISGNQVDPGYGGGVFNAGNMIINDGVVEKNIAKVLNDQYTTNGYGDGGGIYSCAGKLEIYGGDIKNNYSERDGGGVFSGYGLTYTPPEAITTFVMTGGRIENNKCVRQGGGIYNIGTIVMENAIISGNDASDGGGIYNTSKYAHGSIRYGLIHIAKDIRIENNTNGNVYMGHADPIRVNGPLSGNIGITSYRGTPLKNIPLLIAAGENYTLTQKDVEVFGFDDKRVYVLSHANNGNGYLYMPSPLGTISILRNNTNLYEKAELTGETVGKADADAKLPYYDLNNGWYQVYHNEALCYIKADDVQIETELIGYVVRDTSKNWYGGDSLSDQVFSHDDFSCWWDDSIEKIIVPCYRIEKEKKTDSYLWYYVFHNGKMGYVCSDNVDFCDQEGNAKDIPSEACPHVYQQNGWTSISDTQHVAKLVCRYCDNESIDSDKVNGHYQYCNKGVDGCYGCGATGVIMEIYRHASYTYFSINDEMHGYGCPVCKMTKSTSIHRASCNNADACETCEAKDVTIQLRHGYERYTAYMNDEYHSVICSDCDTPIRQERHFADSCVNTEVCASCDTPVEGLKAVCHINADEYEEQIWEDDKYHYSYCLTCKTLIEKFSHERACYGTECWWREGCLGKECDIYHPYEAIDLGNGKHEKNCIECGHNVIESHRNAYGCDAEPFDTRCDECGADDIPPVRDHGSNYMTIYRDEKSHWNVCRRCFEVENEAAHYTNIGDPEGICSYCMAAYSVELGPGFGSIIVGEDTVDNLSPVKVPTLVLPNGTTFDTPVYLKYKELEIGENRIVYDLKLVDQNDKEVRIPYGSIVVFPYPEDITINNAMKYLFTIVHNALKDTEIFSTLEDTIALKKAGLCITVNSFSPFEITWVEQPEVELPQTGDNSHVILWLELLTLAGTAMLILKRKIA